MKWQTFEVEIDHGRVTALGTHVLPEKGAGLLTIQPEAPAAATSTAIQQFLDRWTGAFSRPSAGDDPRLTYLLSKHVR